MKLSKSSVKGVAAILITSMALFGCATPGGTDATASSGESTECNTALAAGIGAVVGGLIGGGKNTLRGAALGAGLGALACVAINYHARQVKSAQQVENEYKVAHKGTLPERTTVTHYDTKFQPATIKAGEKAVLTSNIEVVKGRNSPAPLIEEEATLLKADGKVIKTTRKTVTESPAGGAYSGSFTIPMPAGAPEGVYTLKTALFINGEQAGTHNAKLQVLTASRQTGTALALNAR